MEELYCVMHNGINLYGYTMTPEEKAITERLRKELIDVCDALDVPRQKCVDGSHYMRRLLDSADYCMKYKQDIGYFVLHGERGVFQLQKGFPTKDKNEAKFILLKDEFFTGGLMYEVENREVLKLEWVQKYEIEYDSRKACFEYAIRSLKAVFGEYPNSVIAECTEYLNKWFDGSCWYFDKDTMLFEVHPH